MYNREEFDLEYFEQGPMTGKSLYTNYRWLPELTLPMCHHIITYFGITADAVSYTHLTLPTNREV